MNVERDRRRCRIVRGLEQLVVDLQGRPISLTWRGATYRRGLDGRVLEIRRAEPAEFPHYRMHASRELPSAETEEVLARAEELVSVAGLGLPLPDRRAWCEDSQLFTQVYSPVGILPPERYRALVLQLTRGCAYNRCGFCTFYRGIPFRTLSPDDFRAHALRVRDYFGAGLSLRDGIFLGDAGAGGVSTRRLLQALNTVGEVFPSDGNDAQGRARHAQNFCDVDAFMDTFQGGLRTVGEWQALKEAGLRRLNIGIESGSPEVLAELGKPVELTRASQVVSDLKAAGLQVAVILLCGAGGHRLAASHEQMTADWVRALGLGDQDRVYLSDLYLTPGSDYAHQVEQAQSGEMTRLECRHQGYRLRQALPGVQLSFYDIGQFIY